MAESGGGRGVRRQQADRPGLRSAAVRSFRKSEDEDGERRLAHTVELAVPLCLLYTQQGPIVSKRDRAATETGEGGCRCPVPAGLRAADPRQHALGVGKRQVEPSCTYGLTFVL